jgi:hypothetical protein
MSDDDFDELDELDEVAAVLERLGVLERESPTAIMEETINGAVRGRDGRFEMSACRLRFYADGTQDARLEKQQMYAETIGILCESAACGQPFEALEAVTAMRCLLDLLEHEIVAYARTNGWSWRKVASALNVSPASAHRRFAQVEVFYRRRRHAPPR